MIGVFCVNCKYIKTDSEGNVIFVDETHISPIPVLSGEIAPKGMRRYEHVYCIDKDKVAICDGNDNWYYSDVSGVKSITAGQPWSALFG